MADSTLPSNSKSFQRRVLDWMMETFSMEVTRDTTERNHRYLEESLELVQAMGCTQSEAHQLVDFVYGRPVGEPQQEVGGALVTLAALCSAADFDMTECGDRELAQCWQNIERIRAKQAGKPKHSPLPGPTGNAPFLQDRATGVHGVYCIARVVNGTSEYWTGKEWAAFCGDVHFDLRGSKKAKVVLPTCAHGATSEEVCPECMGLPSDNPDEEIS